jgi:hypothetical protein
LIKFYFEPVIGLSRVSLVNIDNSLSKVVLGGLAVVKTFDSKDGLVGVLSNLGSD